MLDTAVFKKLASNDTGNASGHQAGIVVPKSIAKFFPSLPDVLPGGTPTAETFLNAELFVNQLKVDFVQTRYQHQTWGGTRSPERRLTGNLGKLRNQAKAEDIVLFKRDLFDDNFIQIHLIKQGTPEYDYLNKKLVTRWGPLDSANPPASLEQIKDAESDIEKEAKGTPVIFIDPRMKIKVNSLRKVRDRAFRKMVLLEYDSQCAFSGRKFVSPLSPDTIGLDVAHVVPVHANGSDHPVNGLPLSKDLHWVFDRGLIGVDGNRKITVPKIVSSLKGNEFLKKFNGQPIREAKNKHFRVSDDALDWHRKNILIS